MVSSGSALSDPRSARARLLLDGHNDLPFVATTFEAEEGRSYPVPSDAPGHTDLDRLRRGGVGGQFWAAYVPCDRAGPGASRHVLEHLDWIRRMEAAHPGVLAPAWSAEDVRRAAAEGRVASLVGVEGGHALEGSLAVLRAFRALGARYLTLTHNCAHDWADSATDEPLHGGLSDFGVEVVRELNRLGMLVDLSHTSAEVMRQASEASEAPVVFTHSNARALTDHPRNVPDGVLERIRETRGVVGVTFVPRFLSEEVRRWDERREGEEVRADESPARDGTASGAGVGGRAQEERRGAEGGERGDPPRATIDDVVAHLEHLRAVMGSAHLAVGGDFDGTATTPDGLEDVACYPALFQRLEAEGWSEAELDGLAGGNLLRVMEEAEEVGRRLGGPAPPSCRP